MWSAMCLLHVYRVDVQPNALVINGGHDIAYGDRALVGGVQKMARSNGVLANFVKDFARLFPGFEERRGIHDDRASKNRILVINPGALNRLVFKNLVQGLEKILLGRRKFPSNAGAQRVFLGRRSAKGTSGKQAGEQRKEWSGAKRAKIRASLNSSPPERS